MDTLLSFQLRRAAGAAAFALTRELQPLGLAPSEGGLLLVIGANPGVTQSAIGRAMRTKPANLVPLIAKLARMGVLVRAHGRGRALGLSLTPEGQRLHDATAVAFMAVEARWDMTVPRDERPGLADRLSAMTDAVCCASEHPEAATRDGQPLLT